MKSKIELILGVAGVAVFIVIAVFVYNALVNRGNLPENIVVYEPQEVQEKEPQEGASEAPPLQVPDFAMVDEAGNEVMLSDFFGAPLVVNFWASWCPACVAELSYFETLYQNYGSDVHVIKVNLGETMDTVERFMQENGYSFPLYFDISGAVAFGVQFIPVTFFIGVEGNAAARVQGPVNDSVLEQGLAAILG